MKVKYRYLAIIAPVIFILDQWTKWIVSAHIRFGERIPVIPGFFDLVHFRNKGVAFGMLADLDPLFRNVFFSAIAVVAVGFLVHFFRQLADDDAPMACALSLIAGGMVGNVLDRVRFGEVVDFLSLHVKDRWFDGHLLGMHMAFPLEWPAFNVADSAISIAMILVIFCSFRKGHA